MMDFPPPTQTTCLRMAQYFCDVEPNEKVSWEWLICWAAYEDWVELYWNEQ